MLKVLDIYKGISQEFQSMLLSNYWDILTFHMVKDPVKRLLYNEKDLISDHEIPMKVQSLKCFEFSVAWKTCETFKHKQHAKVTMKYPWNFQAQIAC